MIMSIERIKRFAKYVQLKGDPLYTLNGYEEDGGVELHSADLKALCNSHDALLQAAKGMVDLRRTTEMDYEQAYRAMFKSDGNAAWATLAAAIALAEGSKP